MRDLEYRDNHYKTLLNDKLQMSDSNVLIQESSKIDGDKIWNKLVS